MESVLVVPGVNPVGYVVSCLGSGDIASVVDSFLLQGREKRLGGAYLDSCRGASRVGAVGLRVG